MTQRESDWATLGGMAQGIAGPAAGLATAFNVQSENAKIRAQNEANLRSVVPALPAIFSSADHLRNNARILQREINEMNLKLLGDETADAVLNDLQFSNPHVEVRESGTLFVSVTATAGTEFIYDDVPAVIDGIVKARIIHNGKVLDVVTLVLPLYGIGSGKSAELSGMTLSSRQNQKADHSFPFELKYFASNLWKMER